MNSSVKQPGTTTQVNIRFEVFFGPVKGRVVIRSALACGGIEGRHNFAACRTSNYTQCKQIQLEPLSGAAPTPTRGALAVEGAALGTDALVGDVLAVEMECDDSVLAC